MPQKHPKAGRKAEPKVALPLSVANDASPAELVFALMPHCGEL